MYHDVASADSARRLRADSSDGKLPVIVGLVVSCAVISMLAAVLWTVLRYRRDRLVTGANDKSYLIMFPKKVPAPPPKPKEVHVVPAATAPAMALPKSPAPMPKQRPRSAPKPKCPNPASPSAKERPTPAVKERPGSRGQIEPGSLRVGNGRPGSSGRKSDLPEYDDGGLGPPRAPPPREPLRPKDDEDAEREPPRCLGSRPQPRSNRPAWQGSGGQSPRAAQCEKGSSILQELRNSRREPVESRRSRFRKLCLQYHPDKTGTPSTMETFQYLQEQKSWYLKA